MGGPTDEHSRRPRVVLGVSGGIAAYKACVLLRHLTESDHDVTVVPTAAALQFVGAATWEALSGKPVTTEVFDQVNDVRHVRLGQEADLVLVAPATADLVARAAGGRADDLLTSVLLTASCPVLMAPAMHTEMWRHPATQDNVATLRSRGVLVLDPAYGRLTGVDTGAGRLPDPLEIFETAREVLLRGDRGQDMSGQKVVVSAGGTREHLDPVRYLGNNSSGRQGYAIARVAVARGAEVTLIAANTTLPDPAGAKVVSVVSTEDMHAAVSDAAVDADVVVMAAAPADFRPVTHSGAKIKKASDGDGQQLNLVETADILADVSASRQGGHPVMVGFAAETGDDSGGVMDHARAKLRRKGCDLLVVNDVSGGAVFGSTDTQAVILHADGAEVPVPPGSKVALAEVLWDEVAKRAASGE